MRDPSVAWDDPCPLVRNPSHRTVATCMELVPGPFGTRTFEAGGEAAKTQ